MALNKFFRVAHCELTKEKDDLIDEKLRLVNQKVKEVKADIKEKIEEKAEELWNEVKEKYVSSSVKEAFDFVEEILKNLRDFGKLDEVEFDTPLFVLLLLVKRAQDGLGKTWHDNLPKGSIYT